MLTAPLPERRAPLPGEMLQNPRRGTIFRLIRSASGIGAILTASPRSANTGGLGRNLSSRARRRYSAEPIVPGQRASLLFGIALRRREGW